MNSSDWVITQEHLASLDSIVVRHATSEAECLGVFCHGFGAPGDDLAGLAEWMINECKSLDVKPLLVFPAAPIDLSDDDMPGGRAWWRLNMAKLMQANMTNSFDDIRSEIPEGIDQARTQLVEFVEAAQLKFGMNDKPFILGGFSQGAMLAVDIYLHAPQNPMGLFAWSSALVNKGDWKERIKSEEFQNRLKQNPHPTYFQSHGTSDTVLSLKNGQRLDSFLQSAGMKGKMITFSGGHEIPPQVILGTADYIKSLLSTASQTV